jgi:polyribonucleotide nucleotidyltransferase
MIQSNDFTTEKVEVMGKEITFEIGRYAGQATAAVVGRLGDSVVLVTVVAGAERTDIDWFPLQVEFQEKLYAGGKIKGSRWVKREGRPSDEAILTGRVIDRSIRPLFNKDYKGEVQVVVTPLSADEENDLDVLSICTVSAALAISGLPWEGPLGGTRIGMTPEGSYLAFPTYKERANSKLDVIISSSKDAIVMVEAGANEVTESEMIGALEFAKEQNLAIINTINKLVSQVGKPKIEIAKPDELSEEIKQKLDEKAQPVIADLLKNEKNGKIDRTPLYALVDELQVEYPDAKKSVLKNYLEKIFKQAARNKVIDTKIRLDGRQMEEIRPLTIDVDMLPRTHGSAMFKRGETQALTITTLGSPSFGQTIELMDQEIQKRYIHHYNMPPFSVGETGRVGFPSRREIGHGALAERALVPVLPSEDEFPYAIRVVSECVSSNGSTSMASTCGSTLSLMTAGVPIKKPVAGIAMGLMVKNEDAGIKEGEYVVLTDIQGLEDHIGDMDFKVAGTTDGITAIQMDIKVKGVTTQVLSQALEQAKKARLFILDKMLAVIDKPRDQVSQYAPKIEIIRIKKDQIGEVIGPGGKMIRQIIEQTGAEIDIDDEGKVVVSAVERDNLQKAVEWIKSITKEVQVGEVYENAKVVRVVNFGAFVELTPGKEGLVHVSKMSTTFVKNPADLVKEGDTVKVRVDAIDEVGKIGLSMLFGEDIEKAAANQRDRGGRGGARPQFQNRQNRSFSPRFEKRNQSTTPKTMADWDNK